VGKKLIYRNDDNTIILQFGTGDIEVGDGRVIEDGKDKMFPCVIFAQGEDGPIGERSDLDIPDDEPAEPRPDACITFAFTDIRSFDVVINHLKNAKKRFELNGCKVMSMQEITDELRGIDDTTADIKIDMEK